MNRVVIEEVRARQILDCRGDPTVEAEVILDDGAKGRASVPSGPPVNQKLEAAELRDGGEEWMGKAVSGAVRNVNEIIAPELRGKNPMHQAEVDQLMVELDGTPNKGKLGANAIMGVSLAVADAAANSLGLPLYKYLGGAYARTLPVPVMNLLNGTEHPEGKVEWQELMIMPIGASSFHEALRMGSEVYHHLRTVLIQRGYSVGVGDEGEYIPPLSSNIEGLELIVEAIRSAGYEEGKHIAISLDLGMKNGLYRDGVYLLGAERKLSKSSEELVSSYEQLVKKFPIVSIEDGLAEYDWEGWKLLTERLGTQVQLQGDSLFTTSVDRLRKGVRMGVANSILIKPIHVGTLTETIRTIELAKKSGYTVAMSHRSGETEDHKIADLAVATGADQIKAGACAHARILKYNRLLRIEEELREEAIYLGEEALSQKARKPTDMIKD